MEGKTVRCACAHAVWVEDAELCVGEGIFGIKCGAVLKLRGAGATIAFHLSRLQEVVSLLKKRLRTDNPQKQWLGVLLFQKVESLYPGIACTS